MSVSVCLCVHCFKVLFELCQVSCLCALSSCVLLPSCAIVTCAFIFWLIFLTILHALMFNFISHLLNCQTACRLILICMSASDCLCVRGFTLLC